MNRQNRSQADLLLKNGNIFTADSRQTWAEAVAMKDNRILAVGSNADILPLGGQGTKTFDLQGRAVTPGFNDAHTHCVDAAIRDACAFSLFGVTALEQAGEVITRFAAQNPDMEWLHGRRLDLGRFEGGSFPDRHMLDGFESRRPVAITDIDGHSCWVNTPALQALGFDANTPDPVGGQILREENGFPNGMLLETAGERIPELEFPARMDFRQVMVQTGGSLSRLGITSLSNNGITPEQLNTLASMAQDGDLKFRLSEWPALDSDLEHALWLRERFTGNEKIRVVGLKMFMDGVLSSWTAWLLEPYTDAPDRSGFPMRPTAEMDERVLKADKAGFQVITHAIGDRGVQETLNIYEHAMHVNGRRDSRHRVEHIEMAHPQDQLRFGKLGVIACMQPLHATACVDDYVVTRIGDVRGGYSYPWRGVMDGGAHLCFGTDWPAIDMSQPNPLENIYGAVTRQHPTLPGMPPWHPEQRVTLEQAIRSYTIESAYAEFTEDQKGTLTAGKLADICVLDRNIFSVPPAALLETKVSLTVMDGAVIYRDME